MDVNRLDQLLRLVGEITVGRDRLGHLLAAGTPARTLLEVHREGERLYRDLHEQVMSLRMVPVGPTLQQLARVVRDLSRSLGKQTDLTIDGGEVEVDNSILQMLNDPLMHTFRNALDHGIEQPAEREAKGKPS